MRREELPRTAAEVTQRINEISFNSSLMREMRAVAFVTKLIDDHELDEKKYSRMCMHWIGNERVMLGLSAATHFHPEWSLLSRLREDGRETTKLWLGENAQHVGRRSTIDLVEMFL
jgi:NTE family protein